MSVAIPAVTRLQDQHDVNVSLGVGVDENMLVYDHDTATFVLRAPFAGLLATGATVGATAQAQRFTNGVVSPFNAPAADSTTAWQVRKADKTTAVVTVDTTNARVGIGTTSPAYPLDVIGNARVTGILEALSLTVYNVTANIGTGRGNYISITSNSSPDLATITSQLGGIRLDTTSDGNIALMPNGTGKVGIGTTAPATALHVVGAATVTGGIRPAADSTTALQLQNVAGTSVLNVDTTNGRVGIGTTAPFVQLQLGTTYVNVPDTRLHVGIIGTGAFSNVLTFDFDGNAGIRGVLGGSSDASSYQSLSLGTFGYGGDQSQTLNLRNGNVGIGDTAPAEKLDVTGNINTTGVIKVDDVQVLSNRVIDARCADVANSGDATTDGLIDALRDAMVAHGLLAAAA